MKYFLDTYAMISMVQGTKPYEKYLDEDAFTTIFHLYELFYSLLRDYNEELAKKFFYDFYDKLVAFNDEDIFESSKFKLKHKKVRISYADALGYILAKKLNIKFLTGDKEFANMENVEFVK